MYPNGKRRRLASGAHACLALAALLMAAAPPLRALPEDRLKAIEITAARAERNDREGFTVYSGAVVLEQGSLHIEAERLTIFHDREAADRIVALGAPATLRQQPAPDRGFVTASARRIVYERSRELIVLREAASIEQEGAVVTGESIQYFMAELRVRADADDSDDTARVQVFIPAELVEAQSGDDKANGATVEDRGDTPADSAPQSDEAADDEGGDAPAKAVERGENRDRTDGDAGGA